MGILRSACSKKRAHDLNVEDIVMTETVHRTPAAVPAPRSASHPDQEPSTPQVRVDWSRPTPESRRLSELEQLRIDLAAGR